MLGFLDLVVEACIFFLQVAGVGEDNASQIDGGRGGVNWAMKAFFDQAGNPAAVIEVSMGDDDGVNLFRRDRSVAPVPFAPFFGTLEEPAVDQDLQAAFSGQIASIDEMF